MLTAVDTQSDISEAAGLGDTDLRTRVPGTSEHRNYCTRGCRQQKGSPVRLRRAPVRGEIARSLSGHLQPSHTHAPGRCCLSRITDQPLSVSPGSACLSGIFVKGRGCVPTWTRGKSPSWEAANAELKAIDATPEAVNSLAGPRCPQVRSYR